MLPKFEKFGQNWGNLANLKKNSSFEQNFPLYEEVGSLYISLIKKNWWCLFNI